MARGFAGKAGANAGQGEASLSLSHLHCLVSLGEAALLACSEIKPCSLGLFAVPHGSASCGRGILPLLLALWLGVSFGLLAAVPAGRWGCCQSSLKQAQLPASDGAAPQMSCGLSSWGSLPALPVSIGEREPSW